MPLSMAPHGEERIILKITGRDHIQKHLADLGFVVGQPVTVISEIGGNMILKVKEARLALDKTMASRIMV